MKSFKQQLAFKPKKWMHVPFLFMVSAASISLGIVILLLKIMTDRVDATVVFSEKLVYIGSIAVLCFIMVYVFALLWSTAFELTETILVEERVVLLDEEPGNDNS